MRWNYTPDATYPKNTSLVPYTLHGGLGLSHMISRAAANILKSKSLVVPLNGRLFPKKGTTFHQVVAALSQAKDQVTIARIHTMDPY